MRLSKELVERFGVEPEVRLGWPGQFLVLVDGRKVFSRLSSRRMPRAGEVEDLVEAALQERS